MIQALSNCQSIGSDWLLRLFIVLKNNEKSSDENARLAGIIEVKIGWKFILRVMTS